MDPGVPITVRSTAPFDHCTTARLENATPASSWWSTTHRAPEPGARVTTTTFSAAPPSSCQDRTCPASSARASRVVTRATPMPVCAMSTTGSRPSTTPSTRRASSPSTARGGTSDAARSTAPRATWKSPASEPPAATCTSGRRGCWAAYRRAASVRNGTSDVAPITRTPGGRARTSDGPTAVSPSTTSTAAAARARVCFFIISVACPSAPL